MLAIACFCFTVIFPIWLILFYCFKKPQWQDAAFTERFGSILADTDLTRREHKWVPVLIPIFFLARRAIFIFSVVVTTEFVWLQLALQFGISVGMLVYLV